MGGSFYKKRCVTHKSAQQFGLAVQGYHAARPVFCTVYQDALFVAVLASSAFTGVCGLVLLITIQATVFAFFYLFSHMPIVASELKSRGCPGDEDMHRRLLAWLKLQEVGQFADLAVVSDLHTVPGRLTMCSFRAHCLLRVFQGSKIFRLR